MFKFLSALKRALLSCVIVTAASVGGYYGYEHFEQRQKGATGRDRATPKAQISVVYQGAAMERSLPPAMMPAFELILDSSYSMSAEHNGRSKHDVARQVTKELLAALPDSAQVALRLYGHCGFLPRRQAAPEHDDPRLDTDSELVVPLGGLSRQRRRDFNERIDAALPRGKTPIIYSLLQAKKDFPRTWRGPKTIILLTDGWETCGGTLNEFAAAYGPESGFVVHVVGFSIDGSEAHRQLAEIARQGGGNYYRADGAAALADVLRKAVRSAAFVVYESGGDTIIARGLINGPPLALPAGSYRVAIQGFERNAVKVDVKENAALALSLDEGGALTHVKQKSRLR
jgi:hypothetical protein